LRVDDCASNMTKVTMEFLSNARMRYLDNRKDVQRLLALHQKEGGSDVGRRWGLQALNKSAIVLICAFWEAYCEDLAAEGMRHLVKRGRDHEALSVELRKQIARELEGDTHELATWRLAGDGWRTVLSERLKRLQQERNRRLNTPKSDQIDDLFRQVLGVEKISKCWRWHNVSAASNRKRLDEYVSLRGEIAHRGEALAGVQKKQAVAFLKHIDQLVEATDAYVLAVMDKASSPGAN
jgi:hypothetical protein